MTTAPDDRDDVLLSAYIDGELGPTESRSLEDRIGNDPVLQRRFDIMAGQSVMLRNQSERLLHDGVYRELTDRIDTILDGRATPSEQQVQAGPTALPRKAANNNTAIWTGLGAAAAVLLAFVGGNWFSQNFTDIGAIPPSDAQQVSYSPLNNPALDAVIGQTLEDTLSGQVRQVALGTDEDQKANGGIMIEPLRTFRQNDRFCREYQVTFPAVAASGTAAPTNGFYGRACRTDDGQWHTVYRLIPGSGAMTSPNAETPKHKL